MSAQCELATIDSSMELVIHLGNLPAKITVREAADLLGVLDCDIWAALRLDANEKLCKQLYKEMREVWGGTLEADLSRPLDDSWPDVAELPPVGQLSHEDVLEYLELGEERGGVPQDRWLLPERDLVLPSSPDLFDQLRGVFGHGPRRRRMMEIRLVEHDEHTLDTLKGLVHTLEISLREAAKKFDRAAPGIAALERARHVLHFQDRGWWHEVKKERMTKGQVKKRREAIKDLADALSALQVDALRKSRFPGSERAVAWQLLRHLNGHTAEGAALGRLLESIAVYPWGVTTKIKSELVDYLERAASALARSSHAEEFARDHFLDMLEAACEHPPRGIAEIISSLKRDELRNELTDGWKKTLHDARRGLKAEPAGTSPLAVVARIAKVHRGATKILKSAVSEVTLEAVLRAVHKVNSKSPVGGTARRVSALFLKYLGFTCIQHSASLGKVYLPPNGNVPVQDALRITKNVTYARVLKLVDEVPDVDPSTKAGHAALKEYWRRAGRDARSMRLHEGFLRTPTLVGLSFLLNAATLLAAVTDEEGSEWRYAMSVTAGALGLSGTALTAVELAYLPYAKGTDKVLSAIRHTSKAVGGIAGLLFLAVTMWPILEDRRRTRTQRYVDTMSAVAAGASTASFAADLLAWKAAATGLGIAGVVIGLAALAVTIAVELGESGPEAMVEAYFKYAKDNVEVGEYPIELEAIEGLITEVRIEDGFEDLIEIKGSRAPDPLSGSPTWFKAYKLGFSYVEIARLFDSSETEIEIFFMGQGA